MWKKECGEKMELISRIKRKKKTRTLRRQTLHF
jgi:hypothetical protein